MALGSLVSSTALTGRPLIAFEYSEEALARELELSALRLPLKGPRLRRDFPAHQLGLPGPVYDALPDGWGMLLMDRLFKRRGLNPAHIGPLARLAYIGSHAMGAMSFEPVAPELSAALTETPLAQLACEAQEVLVGEGGDFLQQLLLIGGSPHGARPKALLYRDPAHGRYSTAADPGLEAYSRRRRSTLRYALSKRSARNVCANAPSTRRIPSTLRFRMVRRPSPPAGSTVNGACVSPCRALPGSPARTFAPPAPWTTPTSCGRPSTAATMCGRRRQPSRIQRGVQQP